MTKDKDPSLIPHGMYCYDEKGTCPYWGTNLMKDEQESGWCDFQEIGDWETDAPFGLLWDQVKNCGINDCMPGCVICGY